MKLLLVVSLQLFSFAQNNLPPGNAKLFGRVIDATTKEALPGAVVRILGTTHAVSTDIQSKFNFITAQKIPYTLVVIFIGYETQSLLVNDTNPVEILRYYV